MERKTKVTAEEGRHDVIITRDFDLPVDLLYRAYADPDILAQWMGTRVLKLENKKHGGWMIETSDPKGNVVFSAHGTIHDIVPNQRIVRTFEMENAPFGVQLEFLEFVPTSDDTSRLVMNTVYRTGALRDEMLKLPFAYGINMAHDRLEEIVSKTK